MCLVCGRDLFNKFWFVWFRHGVEEASDGVCESCREWAYGVWWECYFRRRRAERAC